MLLLLLKKSLIVVSIWLKFKINLLDRIIIAEFLLINLKQINLSRKGVYGCCMK